MKDTRQTRYANNTSITHHRPRRQSGAQTISSIITMQHLKSSPKHGECFSRQTSNKDDNVKKTKWWRPKKKYNARKKAQSK